MSYTTSHNHDLPGYNTRQPNDEITEIYRKHRDSLRDERQSAYDAIDEWHRGLEYQLRKHVADQQKLVEQIYEERKNSFHQLFTQYIQNTEVYQENSKNREIEELIKQFKSLKVKLLEISFESVPKDFIQVKPTDPPESWLGENIDANDVEHNKHGDTAEKSQDQKPKIDTDPHKSRSVTSSSTASASTKPKTPQPKDRDSPTKHVNQKETYTDSKDDDTPIDKCPMCLMIFPSRMLTDQKQRHIDEHLTDN